MQKRRIYSAEFKREAVALVSQPGVTKAQIGRELDALKLKKSNLTQPSVVTG